MKKNPLKPLDRNVFLLIFLFTYDSSVCIVKVCKCEAVWGWRRSLSSDLYERTKIQKVTIDGEKGGH